MAAFGGVTSDLAPLITQGLKTEDLISSFAWTGTDRTARKTGVMGTSTFMSYRRGNASMTEDDLQESFEDMVNWLRTVPNVSENMLCFDGSAHDIERFGYFFCEDVLPGHFGDCLNAGRYILGKVLENEFGFEWDGMILRQNEHNLTVDLNAIVIDESKALLDASDAVDECFESIKAMVYRKRVTGR